MECPNCKKEAEDREVDGVTFIKCETCGCFELTPEGEAIPVDCIPDPPAEVPEKGGDDIPESPPTPLPDEDEPEEDEDSIDIEVEL